MPSIGLPVVEAKATIVKKSNATEEENGWCSHSNQWSISFFLFKFYLSVEEDYFEEDAEPEPEPEPDSLANMLNNSTEDDYYGYEDAYV